MILVRKIIVIAAVFATLGVNAQRLSVDWQTRFSQVLQQEAPEKLFVHIDRASYLTGETMWWKAYLVSALTHQPSLLSKVGYLELLDSDNIPVLQLKIGLNNGLGDGNLFLPASLNSGHYRLCAYTQWMRNESPDFFFYQPITIINPFKKTLRGEATPSNAIDVQLLPEGGYLVAGLPAVVAFRGVDQTGKGITFSGVVVTHNGDTIERFSPISLGLGQFEFTPIAGTDYKAFVKFGSKSWQPIPFPKIEQKGTALHVERVDNSVVVTTYSSNTPSQPLTLLIHSRMRPLLTTKINGSNISEVKVSLDSLRDGINHIVLLNALAEPLAERLFFKRPLVTNDPKLVSDKTSYGTREKVMISWPAEGLPKNASVSVAVSQIDSLGSFKRGAIEDYLLLSSDLHGTIESPSLYSNSNAETDKMLDLVMLTHGWSRFNWKKASETESANQFLPEYRGHVIHALVKTPNGTPAPNVTTLLGTPSNTIRIYPAISNDAGEMAFEMKSFVGPRKVILQPYAQEDSLLLYSVISPFASVFTKNIPVPFSLSPSLSSAIIERSISMQAENIYHNPPAQKLNEDSTTFYGEPDERYRLDDYTRFPVLEEVLREYVAGIRVRKRNSQFIFQIPDKVNGGLLGSRPLVLLDGVPLHNINPLMELDPLKIKEIETVNRTYYLNGVTFPGIAIFKTYVGDMGNLTLPVPATKVDYDGIQGKKVFYHPAYDSPLQKEGRVPDKRSLLYWEPNPHQGKSLEFYTSDLKGNFAIDVQGLTAEGQLIHLSGTIKVQ